MASFENSAKFRLVLFFVLVGLVFAIANKGKSEPAVPAVNADPMSKFAALNIKFEAADSCNACHKAVQVTTWKEEDRHSKSFQSLTTPKALAYGAALQIADVKTSDKCLSCHAINVGAALQNGLATTEGVSCDACHGPSDGWETLHQKKGWAAAQRTTMKPAEMLQKFGFNDTKNVVVRADNCTKCHLAIDASLVKAGHPQPAFEINQYTKKMPKHWTSDPAGYFVVKNWSAGEAVCARDAMSQLAQRAAGGAVDVQVKQAFAQAMSYGELLPILLDAVGKPDASLQGHLDKLKAAMGASNAKDMQTEATAIANIADNSTSLIDSFNPDAAITKTMMQAIANKDALSKDYGRRGAEQQAYSIYSFYYAYATAEKVPVAGDKVKPTLKKLVGDTAVLKWEENNVPFSPESMTQFAGLIGDLKTSLPK